MKSKGKTIHLPNKKNIIIYSILNIFLIVLIYLYFWGTRIQNINVKPFPTNEELEYIKEVDIKAVASDVLTKPLYSFNSNELVNKIKDSSNWVKAVHIEKVFPNTLNIWIDENIPEFCMRTIVSENDELIRYFAYNDGKFLGEVYQKLDCAQIGQSESFNPDSLDDFFEDSSLYYCLVDVEKIVNKCNSIQSRFLVREYIINSPSEVSIVSYDQTMSISCLLDYQRSLFYFDKALENYPDHTKGKEFMLYEDSVVVK